MAGAGYKLFQTGDVLTAAQVNTYLNEQTVMVFANAAARTSALTSVLAEGMMSYLQDTNSVEVYNGSSWVNVGNAGDITEVQAGTGISVASGTGPIPVITNTVATAFDAAGDLVYGTGADTFTKLSLGTAGKVLTVNSGATAPEWATPAGGGKVLQVVSGTYSTETTVASTTYTDSGLTLNITPSSASSKVMVLISFSMIVYGEQRGRGGKARIMRDATAVVDFGGTGSESTLGGVGATTDDYEQNQAILGFSYLDSPATTSAITYKVQLAVAATTNNSAVRAQFQGATSTITLMEIGA